VVLKATSSSVIKTSGVDTSIDGAAAGASDNGSSTASEVVADAPGCSCISQTSMPYVAIEAMRAA
jgi:hypothetical protein